MFVKDSSTYIPLFQILSYQPFILSNCLLNTLCITKVFFSLNPGYVAFFITACVLDFQRAIALVILTSLAVVSKTYDLLKTYQGDNIVKCLKPALRCFKANQRWITW